MKTTIFTVNDREYNLVLRAKDLANLENRLKRNPLGILMDIDKKDEMPKLNEILAVLYYGLQKEHKNEFNNFDKIYDLYDEFVEGGGAYTDLIVEIVKLFQTSGLIPEVDEEEEEPKNA